MSDWINNAKHIVTVTLGNPGPIQGWFVAAAGIVGVLLALSLVASMFSMPNVTTGNTVLLAVLGIVLALVAAIATRLYIHPHLPSSGAAPAVTAAVELVLLLGVLTPLTMFVRKSPYIKAACTWAVAVAAAAVFGVMTYGVGGMIHEMSGKMGGIKDRTGEVNENVEDIESK